MAGSCEIIRYEKKRYAADKSIADKEGRSPLQLIQSMDLEKMKEEKRERIKTIIALLSQTRMDGVMPGPIS